MKDGETEREELDFLHEKTTRGYLVYLKEINKSKKEKTGI